MNLIQRQCQQLKGILEETLLRVTELDKAATVSTAYVIGIVKRDLENSIDEVTRAIAINDRDTND